MFLNLISSQYDNLFRSIYVGSFDNGLIHSLTLSTNSFISLSKSFMNIKSNGGLIRISVEH